MSKLKFSGVLDSKFIEKRNFYVAFDKLKAHMQGGNEWFDSVMLSDYQANLEKNVNNLINEIKRGDYSPKPISPLPYPKSRKNNKFRLRQYFKISINDQLIWIALVNIIGPRLDNYMPFWSYGNRLYRPVWTEPDDNGEMKTASKGYPYTSNKIYNNWSRSWPLYRRHLALTVSAMANPTKFRKGDIPNYVNEEWFNNEVHKDLNFLPRYFLPKYFGKRKVKKLFWMGLDFWKFFPSIKAECIIFNIEKYLKGEEFENRDDVDDMVTLLKAMLKYPLHIDEGWENNDLDKKFEYNLTNLNYYEGIPTGLAVGGFLANISMLDIDLKLSKLLKENRDVALLKFVDDQVIMSRTKKDLKLIYTQYSTILKKSGTGVLFNSEKIEPKGIVRDDSSWKGTLNIEEDTLDPEFPAPLMSHTIQKMSDINNEDFELANEDELDDIERNLRQFYAAETTEAELKKDTRLAFSAAKLCQLVQYIQPKFNRLSMNHSKLDQDDLNYRLNINDRKEVKLERDRIDKRFEYLFKLLLKTAKEQPSKVKIWNRCIEFCAHTGYKGVETIFETIDKSSKITEQAKSYVRAYCYYSLTEYLSKAFNKVNDDETRVWNIHCSFIFLSNIREEYSNIIEIFKQNNGFEVEAIAHKNFQSISKIIFSEKIKVPKHLRFIGLRYKEIELLNKQIQFEGKHLVNVLDNLNRDLKIKVWAKNIDSLEDSDSCLEHLMLTYPDISKFEEVIRLKSKFDWNNNQLFKCWKLNLHESNHTKLEKKDLDLHFSYSYKSDNFITLHEWMEWINSSRSKDLDPRVSEWTALEIVQQIAKKLKSKKDSIKKDIFSFFESDSKWSCIHPNNYLLPKAWLVDSNALSWQKWIKTTSKNSIEFRKEDDFIYDPRYLPVENFWGINPNNFEFSQFPIVIGLSVLLAKILSNNKTWEIDSNGLNSSRSYSKRIESLIEDRVLSSETIELLKGVSSIRNFDFFFSPQDSIQVGEFQIKNIDSFIKAIESIQKILVHNQSSFNGKSPRQLVPIEIENLIRFK